MSLFSMARMWPLLPGVKVRALEVHIDVGSVLPSDRWTASDVASRAYSQEDGMPAFGP